MVYSIQVRGLSQKHIHGNCRQLRDAMESVDVRLSVSGRAATNRSTAAWLNSRELAEAFLAYWEPRLKSRWAEAEFEIIEEIAGGWQKRWMAEASIKAVDMISDSEVWPALRRRLSVTTPIATYLIGVASGEKQFLYYCGKIQGKAKLGEGKIRAERYVTAPECEQVMAGLNEQLSASMTIVRISEEEALELQEKTDQDKAARAKRIGRSVAQMLKPAPLPDVTE
ncbi:hypothetical protein [Marinimicrobium sp. ABcell2]|uniref:hypothetical protein n=1 Tax=Marinimicrobium sp. ABcell2 TaxID=3069751 RepID=UPI0027B02E75|nr:hypothetical protein [Marinimicrobium sp. ABcell2]MDQ2077363.1 hypothetical protein [Marinimicrobium sp. ABcell2]